MARSGRLPPGRPGDLTRSARREAGGASGPGRPSKAASAFLRRSRREGEGGRELLYPGGRQGGRRPARPSGEEDSGTSSREREEARRKLEELAARVIDHQLDLLPPLATDLGIHDRDDRLGEFDQAAAERAARKTRELLGEAEALDTGSLDPEELADWRTLRMALESLRLLLEEERPWASDPSFPMELAAWSVLSLARRSFGSPESRLRALVGREEGMPALFEAARHSLENPPEIRVRIALEQLPGTAAFFERELPAAFAGVGDAALRRRFEEANRRVVDAFRRYTAWVEEELLPGAHGSFALGERLFRAKLRWQEGVETPLDVLERRGREELRRLQELFREAAGRIAPGREPVEVLREQARQHPAAGEVLDFTRGLLAGLRRFCEERRIVTIPSPVDPAVVETPPFMRATTLASIDPPGPFERESKEAFFQVTLPDPRWNAEQKEQHLGALNRYTAEIIAVHEVFPGHYVQFLHLPASSSRVRKVFSATTFTEGWAHYTEEMMLDEGLGDGDPRLRLSQAMEALERAGRYLVAIGMHAGGMRFEEAVDLFRRECHMEPVAARREALRGTTDAMYLAYTLGKLEILDLRDAWRRRQEARREPFDLRAFHDAFLAHGAPALPVLRDLLLDGEPGPEGPEAERR
ncbi:MAG: DUF885 domain-containing protein [Bacillota bacterium]|nr:DUF885 domain-containing protein [Bacillota bacterium]